MADAFSRAWSLVKDDGAWDSTCDKCGYHYYNAEGDGPLGNHESHGDQGWINESDFDFELERGEEMREDDTITEFMGETYEQAAIGDDHYQFHNWLQKRMNDAGWDNICGVCKDGLRGDWERTRKKWT